MNKIISKVLISLFLFSLFACDDNPASTVNPSGEPSNNNSPFTLTSSSFTNSNGVIAVARIGEIVDNQGTTTTSGGNQSPPLQWENAPSETKYFYILMQDQQSPSWEHWLVKDIAPTTNSLPAGYTGTSTKDWEYYGPTPPPGSGTHTYIITIYAVDKTFTTAADTVAMKTALDNDNLGTASITGTYTNPN